MKENRVKRIRRHKRVRKKIMGTESRPRLCVYRGLSNIHAQLIDDINEKTLVCASTQEKAVKKKIGYGGNLKAAFLLGEILAERANKKGFTQAVFDRAGFIYHGRVKALADACREHGLKL